MLIVAWITLSAAIFVPNRLLVWFGLSHSNGFGDAVSFLGSFYGSLFTNFTLLAAMVSVVISLLFGLNVALLIFYVRMMRGNGGIIRTVSSLSLSGLVSGFFGIGCSVCGSVILTSLLSLIGASGLLLFLPLHGEEFSFIAVGLLGYALFVLLRRIETGKVCSV
jgi:hypothetical protein